MRFTEAELTAALSAAAKTVLASQSKEIRKGRVDGEQAWRDLGGYGRYQLLDQLSDQVLPVLVALPDVPRVVGQRATYSGAEVRAAVEQHVGEVGGRLKRTAVVMARVALVQAALAGIPVHRDPDTFVVPDSL